MASLRENMGYHTTMFSGRKEAVMIFSPEQALLKAQSDLQDLVAFARQAADDGLRIDPAERELMQRLLALGLNLLQLFIAKHGDGDLGGELPAEDGHTLRRLPKPHDRRYVSIFGELHIDRTVRGCSLVGCGFGGGSWAGEETVWAPLFGGGLLPPLSLWYHGSLGRGGASIALW